MVPSYLKKIRSIEEVILGHVVWGIIEKAPLSKRKRGFPLIEIVEVRSGVILGFISVEKEGVGMTLFPSTC